MRPQTIWAICLTIFLSTVVVIGAFETGQLLQAQSLMVRR